MTRSAGVRALTCAIVLVLIGTLAGPAADAAPAPAPAPNEVSPASPSQVDVGNPEAGITDPAAGVQVLDRNCADGQTDVNTATAGRIAEAFGLKSSPTVNRIIKGRPWLTPSDLVSVPGVGPQLEPILVAKGCSTPLKLPEDAPLACINEGQVDLQVAPADLIARKANLPMVAADAIVAHRPVPQDLTQIVAPRTPGLGLPKLKALLAAETVCVTPVPFTYTGTDWRWIYPNHGGVIESSQDPDYALIVPAGTVTSATFGKVTPMPEAPLPTADFHLYGPFIGEVAARLPDFGAGDPLLLHQDANAGLSVSWGDSTAAEPGGTVVGPLKSLSEVSSSGLQAFCNPSLITDYSMNVFCMNESPRDLPILQLIEKAGRVTGERRASYRPSGECSTGLVRLVADGSTPPGLLCSATVDATNQSRSTWTFSNVLASSLVPGFIESFGAIYNVGITGGVSNIENYSTSPGPENSGVFSGRVARVLADRGVLVAGAARNFVKPQGEAPTVTTAFVEDVPDASMFYAIFQAVGIADAGLSLAQRDIPGVDILGCVTQAVDTVNGNGSSSAVVQCFQAALSLELEMNAKIADDAGDATRAARFRGYAAGLKKVSFALQLTNYASSMITALLTGGPLNDQSMKFEYLAPPPPTGGGAGGSGSGSATAGDIALDGSGNFIARTSTGASFLVYPTGMAYPIKDGGDFLCYARRLAVVDYVQYFTVGSKGYLNLGPDATVESTYASDCLARIFQ